MDESWKTVLIIAIIAVIDTCSCSHFRGAHFWWRPLPGGEPYEIEVNVRISWRRDYSERTFCDEEVIRSGELIGPVDAGYILCVTNCNANIGDLDFRCTDYSNTDDWVSGLRTHVYQFPGPGIYQTRWRGRSWLEAVLTDVNDVDWEFLTTYNLNPHPDTGRINSSPKAAIGTLFRVQEGCEQTLLLPVTDEDGDRISCRWAQSREECGGICGPLDGFDLDPRTCTLTFAPRNPAGLYAHALQIEDFLWNDDSQPLSSVPLQFIVHVYPSPESLGLSPDDITGNSSCYARPVFLPPTPEAESCTEIEVGRQASRDIIVRTKDQYTSIVEIATVSSLGMRKSELQRYGDDPRDYYVTITWTPQALDLGEHIFCFAATDNEGQSSDQICVYVLVGESGSPIPTPEQVHYDLAQELVIVDFNTAIQVSSDIRELSIYNADDDSLVLRLDTSNAQLVYAVNNTLHINASLETDTSFYILMEQGVVATGSQCGTLSEAVTEKETLAFTSAFATTTTTTTTKFPTYETMSNHTFPEKSTGAFTTHEASKGHTREGAETPITTDSIDSVEMHTAATTVIDNSPLNTDSSKQDTTKHWLTVGDNEEVTIKQDTAASHTRETRTKKVLITIDPDFGNHVSGRSHVASSSYDTTAHALQPTGDTDSGGDNQAVEVTPRPVASRSSGGGTSYLWLIVTVIVVVFFLVLLVIIAILVRRHLARERDEYDREARQEQYLRSIQNQTKIVGYDGPYAPNFHDIEVKFR